MAAKLQGYHYGLLSNFIEGWRLRRAVQRLQPGNSVLDVACNEGKLVEYLSANTSYIGIDINERAIDQARQRYPTRTFLSADLTQAPPLYDKQFDAIFMLAFLEHVADPAKLLISVKRYLNPTGQIIITTPSPHSRGLHDFGARIGLFSRDAANEHQVFLNKNFFVQLGQTAGLRLVHFEYFMFGFNQLACLIDNTTG
jgi:ubiquinone/menaquinone biosynthesis C-methylase UbiE